MNYKITFQKNNKRHKMLKKMKKKDLMRYYDRQLLFMNIALLVMFMLLLSVCSIFLFREGFLDKYLVKTFNINDVNVSIDVSDLTPSEKKVAYSIISETKQVFLTRQKKIIFEHNLSKDYHGSLKSEDLLGFNTWDGENYIRYSDDVRELKNTYSHELLHSYLCRGSDLCHDAVYELAKTCPVLKGGCE